MAVVKRWIRQTLDERVKREIDSQLAGHISTTMNAWEAKVAEKLAQYDEALSQARRRQ